MAEGIVQIGTSGFHYKHWRGIFYPESLPVSQWLDYYARHFGTVELNSTFYRLPAPATVDNWRDRVPDDFRYVLKFSQYATHRKRLRDPEPTLTMFMKLADRLGHRLDAILVQLPPNFLADADRLDRFLAATPRHCRWAVEFRDPSWLTGSVFDVLTRHEAALCIHDKFKPHPEVVTVPWVYLRYHGATATGDYTDEELKAEAARIRRFRNHGLDVYAFFNNDLYGHAVRNAMTLRTLVTG